MTPLRILPVLALATLLLAPACILPVELPAWADPIVPGEVSGSLERAENKVIGGRRLRLSDLASLEIDELRVLRNAVFARHGRQFNSPELQDYFESRSWYRRQNDYSERRLTATDKANVNLIQLVEKDR